jgi:hypothetical protein
MPLPLRQHCQPRQAVHRHRAGLRRLFVFGGPSRFADHGVPKVYPGTADPALGLAGRPNITLRVTGLNDGADYVTGL